MIFLYPQDSLSPRQRLSTRCLIVDFFGVIANMVFYESTVCSTLSFDRNERVFTIDVGGAMSHAKEMHDWH